MNACSQHRIHGVLAGLLSDDLMIRVVASKLDLLQNKVRYRPMRTVTLAHWHDVCFQHWILDGFPRTLGQGELLDVHLRYASFPSGLAASLSNPCRNKSTPLTLVVNLDVADDIILGRISGALPDACVALR